MVELSEDEIHNRAECVFNSLDKEIKELIYRDGDDDYLRLYINEIATVIHDLYPDLTEEEFDLIVEAVYGCLEDEAWFLEELGKFISGNRFAS